MNKANLNGKLVRQLRADKLITQSQLAELAGVRAETLCRLELGQQLAQFQTIKKIANALGVDATDLVLKDKNENN